MLMRPLLNRIALAVLAIAILPLSTLVDAQDVTPNVKEQQRQFREFYLDRFPNVALDEFVYGVYAIDEKLKRQFEEINEFPPYEFALDEGRELALQRSADGSDIMDCLGDSPVHRHPYFDERLAQVVTLASAINVCRQQLGLAALSYQKQAISSLHAYLSTLERSQRRVIELPKSKAALAAFERGKAYFFTKRGQLNLACADCHIRAAGQHLREQTLAPLLGVVNHYPVYGLRWGALGSLHQRFVGCIEQVRGEAAALQSKVYAELEYFLAIMADGLPIVGPTTHR